MDNPATPLRLRIEQIAKNIQLAYSELKIIYEEVCRVEEKIDLID